MHDARGLILKKVSQLFPRESPESILAILDLYGIGQWETEKERVQLGILKLSEGSLEKLLHYVQTAKQDPRDVMAFAEYPNEMSVSAAEISAMPLRQAKALRKKDSDQLAAWLQDDDAKTSTGEQDAQSSN